MSSLTNRLHSFLSQNIARRNAATAAGRLLRERQQRAEVEAYLAQADRSAPSPPPGPGKSAAG